MRLRSRRGAVATLPSGGDSEVDDAEGEEGGERESAASDDTTRVLTSSTGSAGTDDEDGAEEEDEDSAEEEEEDVEDESSAEDGDGAEEEGALATGVTNEKKVKAGVAVVFLVARLLTMALLQKTKRTDRQTK